MTQQEFQKLKARLEQVLTKFQDELIKKGIDIMSPKFDLLLQKIRDKFLKDRGLTQEQYDELENQIANEEANNRKRQEELQEEKENKKSIADEMIILELAKARGLRGEPGVDGIDGVDGKDGIDGKQGIQGVKGADGKDGKDGKDGADGLPGANGKDGKDGSPDTRQQIVEKINTGKKGDLKIEAKQVEGFDKLTTKENLDRAIGILDQRTKFLINKPGGNNYTLPTASASVLGGIKVGTRLSIDGDGVLSADVQAGSVDDTAYGASWDGDTTTAPSKNAVYDKIETLAGGHDAVTLGADAGAILGLTGQQIDLDTQTANYVFAGPINGVPADPTFRALVAADIPDLSGTYQPLDATLTALAALDATAGILKQTGADTFTKITDSSANWDTAYTDRLKWDGGATGLVAATGRTSLGLVIGTDVQAYHANLTSLAGLSYVSTSFVKMTSAGTFALDTNTYLTGNQTITLSGDVSGSGTTAITATIGADKITEAMLKAVDTASDEDILTYEATTGDFEWHSATEVKTAMSLNLVENTALSTWAGTTNITTLGTIATGVWNGTDIGLAYIAGGVADANAYDFGGAASFEIPNGTGGTTDATGEIYFDTNGDGGTNFSGEVIQIYTGAANKYLFPAALPLAASQDNYVLKYDATAKTVQWEADADSGGTPTVITVANEAADTTCFLGFFTAATGDLGPKTNANLTFDSSTGVLTLVAPILGTPTSGTLTNCSGLPLSGVVDSTSEALGVGSVELGHATDTTLSRSAAGVLAVEGVVIPSISSTNTLTNKRITIRYDSTTSSATPTINTDNVDMYGLTAQAADITSFTTNLSGTPTEGQRLWIQITGTAARAITWGASFEASTVALPTTTVTTNRLDVGFVWNTVTSKWRCIAAA